MDIASIYSSPLGNVIKEQVENFQVSTTTPLATVTPTPPATAPVRGFSIASLFSSLLMAIMAILGLLVFLYASYLTYKCTGLSVAWRWVIFLSFFIIPVIAPLAFIIYNFVSPICKGTRVVMPRVAIPKITVEE